MENKINLASFLGNIFMDYVLKKLVCVLFEEKKIVE